MILVYCDFASYIAYITTRAMSPNCAPIKVCYYTPLTGWRVTIVYYKLFNNLLYPLTFNFTATPLAEVLSSPKPAIALPQSGAPKAFG